MKIDWKKYGKLYGICENCDKEIDFDHKIKDLLQSNSEEELREIQTQKDIDFNQACDICYHIHWITGERKLLLNQLIDEFLKEKQPF